MPILYKNNPMPLDGALFVTNPRKRRNLAVRENNAKDRFIRNELNMPLARVKAIKKSDYEAYQDLFEKAGGSSAFSKRKASKKTRMDKFFAALPDGDTRKKRRSSSKKRASSAKKRSSTRKGAKRSSKKMSYSELVGKHMKAGKSMKAAHKAAKAEYKKNPLVGAALDRYQKLLKKDSLHPFQQDLVKRLKVAHESGVTYSTLKQVMAMKNITQAKVKKKLDEEIKKARQGRYEKRQRAADLSKAKYHARQKAASDAKNAQTDVKQGKIKVTGSGASCDLKGAWERFVIRARMEGKKISYYNYYKKYIPAAIAECVKAGKMTAEEGKKLKAKYAAKYKSKHQGKSTSTSTRSKTVAKKKSKKSSSSGKKITTLASVLRRGGLSAKLTNKIKKGKTMLTWPEFTSAFKGCGHTQKGLGRMYKSYKAAFMKGAPVKRKTSSKKRAASAKKRGSAKKASDGITLTYIKKLLRARRKKGKGRTTLTKKELSTLKEAVPHIQRLARKFMREGDSKYSAVNKAITRARSRTQTGKRRRYKGVNLRSKGAIKLFNPRRRNGRRNPLPAFSLPVALQLKPFAKIDELNKNVSSQVASILSSVSNTVLGIFGGKSLIKENELNYAIQELVKFGELAATHVGVGLAMDKSGLTNWLESKNNTYVNWMLNNAYYSTQGLIAFGTIIAASSIELCEDKSVWTWGLPALATGVFADVLAKLVDRYAPSEASTQGFGEAYTIGAPRSQQLSRLGAIHTNPRALGAVQMNPRSFGAVSMNGLHLNGLEGHHGAVGHQGAQGYGSVLFSGNGY